MRAVKATIGFLAITYLCGGIGSFFVPLKFGFHTPHTFAMWYWVLGPTFLFCGVVGVGMALSILVPFFGWAFSLDDDPRPSKQEELASKIAELEKELGIGGGT